MLTTAYNTLFHCYKENDMADDIKVLPVIDTVKAAWGRVSGAKATFWSILFIVFILQFILGILNKHVDASGAGYVVLIFSIAIVVIQLFISWGLIYLGVQRALDLPIQYGMVRYVMTFGLFCRMIGVYILQFLILAVISCLLGVAQFLSNAGSLIASILSFIIVVVWAVLFVIMIIRMYLSKPLVIVEGLGPWVAIKRSIALTRNNVWPLIGIAIINILIVVVSAIPLGIGLIWSLPYVFISYGVVYRRLAGKN